jgi:hypothetical protein
MKKLVLGSVISLFFNSVQTFAQTSLLQDKAGETSIVNNSAKSIFINSGDANITFSMPFSYTDSNNKGYFMGIDARFKANGGVSQIVNGYELKPQVDAGAFYGRYLPTKDSRSGITHYAFVGGKLNNSSFNLLNNDNSNTFRSEHFTGYSVNWGYNRIGSVNIFKVPKKTVDPAADRLKSSWILGVAAKFGRSTNLDDLRLVDVSTSRTVNNGNNTQSTVVLQKKSAYNGDYEVLEALRINVDSYIYPQFLGGRYGIGGFYRGQLTGKYQRSNAGIGMIVGQEDAPSRTVLGVFYQANDIFDQLNKEPLFIKRTSLTLNAGYSF